MVEEKLWTKNFIGLSAINALVYLIFYLLMIIVATYSMEVLHTSASQAGLAAGVFMFAALLGRLYTGRYIEIVGKKKLLYYGTFFYLLLLPFYFLVNDPLLFIGIRFLHGLGMGVSTSALATLSVYLIPPSRRGEGLGYYALSSTLAMAIGPMFGMYIYSHWGFAVNVYFCLALAVVIAVALLFMHIPDFTADVAALEKMGTGLSSFFAKSALPISAISSIIFFCYSGLTGFLASYVKVIDLVEPGNVFFLAYSIILFISRPPMGRAYDRLGSKIIYLAFIVFILGMVLLSQAGTAFQLLSAAVCLGFGFGNFTTLGRAVSLEGLPPHQYGLASATFLAVSEIGTGFGPFLLGLMLPSLGYRTMYLSLSFFAFVAMLLFKRCYGKGKR